MTTRAPAVLKRWNGVVKTRFYHLICSQSFRMILKTVIGKIEKILIKRLTFQLQSSAFFLSKRFLWWCTIRLDIYLTCLIIFICQKSNFPLSDKILLGLSDILLAFVRYLICICQMSHLHLSDIVFAFVRYLICICHLSHFYLSDIYYLHLS